MAHAWFQTKKIAWLEGVRIHPAYRGQGLAGKLNVALTRYAARKGATTARLCTGSSNMASRRHLDKTGFKILERFQRLQSQRPLKRRPRGVTRLRSNSRAWRWIKGRPEFDLFHQMYSDGWTWHPLNSRAFASFARQGGVISTGLKTPSSCSLFSKEEGRITLGFTAGNPKEITEHGRYLRLLAARGGEKVRALVPKGSKLVTALERAGFEKSGTILVYEKLLIPKSRNVIRRQWLIRSSA